MCRPMHATKLETDYNSIRDHHFEEHVVSNLHGKLRNRIFGRKLSFERSDDRSTH